MKIFSTLILLLVAQFTFCQDATATVAEDSRPLFEKFGMTELELFTIMLVFTLILVVTLLVLANTLKNLLNYKINNLKKGAKTIALLIGIGFSSTSFSATEQVISTKVISMPDSTFWAFIMLDLLLIGAIFYFKSFINSLLNEYVPTKKTSWFKKWNKQLGDAVPIEQESSIILDHDYDGIKELDNNLPPWWKYGFYVTIAWSVFYLFYYQILEIGPLQMTEYQTEMLEGDRADAAYKEAHPELITADNVIQLEDQSSINKGSEIYIQYCQTCHMEKGKGGTGPNLTDNTWLYGGDIKSLFNTISNGTTNGMTAWKELIPGNEIQAVASYIMQMEYIAPPNGKLPEGTIIAE